MSHEALKLANFTSVFMSLKSKKRKKNQKNTVLRLKN